MDFQEFWGYIQNNLKEGDTIENWSRDGKIRIKKFEIEEVNAEFIGIKNVQLKARKSDFEYIYNNWDLYLDHRLDRQDIVHKQKIMTSTYVIALIHHFKK